MRQTVMNLRASSRDVALIDQAAEIEGKTRSAFIRECTQRAALKIFETPRELGDRCPVCGSIVREEKK